MKKLYTSLIFAVLCLLSFTAGAQTIGGTLSLCVGGSTTLTGTPTGGSWSVASSTIAYIVDSTGYVYGSTAGTTAVTYTTSSGSAVAMLTVNPAPAAITGSSSVGPGSSITLTDATPGGVWSSSNPAVATVGMATGVVTGVSCGSTTITYSLPSGCYKTKNITVGTVTGTIGGPSTLCIGSTGTMTNTVSGGTWSMVFGTGVATVNPTSGVITGVSAGMDSVRYTLTTSCGTVYQYFAVNVVAPGTIGAISGSTSVSCGGTITLVGPTSGGTWSSSTTSVATVSSISSMAATVVGVSAGTTTITFTGSTACGMATTTAVITVSGSGTVSPITGASSVCVGSTIALSDATPGGVWTIANANASISSSGVVTGVTAGADTVYYSVTSGCGTGTASKAITVNAAGTVGPITGTTTVSCSGTTSLADATSGGAWSSSSTSIATVNATTGVVSGVAPGTAIITYSVSSCGAASATAAVTVTGMTLTASSSAVSCSEYTMGSVTGGSTYSWLPTTGLTCSACGTTYINPAATTTYTITSGSGACSSSTTLTVNGNRINGHIHFTSAAPTSGICEVWLVQFNPADSSLTALDSMTTCNDSLPYYHFDGKAAGNYMVKAKLLSSVAGTSGYVPTYGLSSSTWSAATTITHGATATNTQNINMIFGTVPSGPGFIGGYVYAGAGKGTSGEVPVAGMIIYLKDGSGNVLTYTYTDATGAYSFSSLGVGSYVIYPENFSFYTTPSSTIVITAAAPSHTGVSFREYTTSGVIKPWVPTSVIGYATTNEISVMPNPASDHVNILWQGQPTGDIAVTITDMAGRVVYNNTIAATATSGEQSIDLSKMQSGVYFIQVRSAATEYRSKLLLVK